MDATMLSMTVRMSTNCSSVDLALGGGGVDMAVEGVEHRKGEQWWWWGLVVECAAPVVEFFWL
jgi:hypothetical protein